MLIGVLTTTSATDIQLQQQFVQNYPSFLSDKKLLSKLKERYDVPETFPKSLIRSIKGAVMRFITIWINNHVDHLDKSVLLEVLELIQSHHTPNDILKEKISNALTFEPLVYQRSNDIVPWGADDIFMSLDEDTIAKQLTLMDFTIYKSIHERELLQCAWSNSKLRYRAVNVLKLIHRQNSLSYWVGFTIVQAKTLKERVKIWTKWIQVASVCIKKNNIIISLLFTNYFINISYYKNIIIIIV